MDGDSVKADVRALLAIHGLEAADLALERCAEGGNNRVFVVRSGGRSFVAKSYFVHPGDTRNRLDAECGFVEYAVRAGIGAVPRLIACNRERHLAVFEHIGGRKLTASEVTATHVAQAARFADALNAPGARPLATALPVASEACFSLADHFATVDRRIARLGAIAAETNLDRSAIAFSGRLTEGWTRLRQRLAHQAERAGEDVHQPLDPAGRCVSPSDFGFHNALERPSGELCFIDFEYAGWDDPAKMIGDFFSQPAVPVPERHFDAFVGVATRFALDPEAVAERAQRLLPLFRIKWCCIMLNVFLPVSRERRRFADPDFDEAALKERQLELACASFSRIVV